MRRSEPVYPSCHGAPQIVPLQHFEPIQCCRGKKISTHCKSWTYDVRSSHMTNIWSALTHPVRVPESALMNHSPESTKLHFPSEWRKVMMQDDLCYCGFWVSVDFISFRFFLKYLFITISCILSSYCAF